MDSSPNGISHSRGRSVDSLHSASAGLKIALQKLQSFPRQPSFHSVPNLMSVKQTEGENELCSVDPTQLSATSPKIEVMAQDEILQTTTPLAAPSYECLRQRISKETRTIFRENNFGTEDKFTFDRTVRLCQRIFQTRYAGMTLVGAKDVEIIAQVGFGGGDIPPIDRSIAPCAQLAKEDAPLSLLVPDTLLHPDFVNHPFVTGPMGMRCYFGVPLMLQGYRVGTFFVADVNPRHDLQSQRSLETLVGLADTISAILMEQRQKALSFDCDFAKISVGLFAHLKQPLADAKQSVLSASSKLQLLAQSSSTDARAIQEQRNACLESIEEMNNGISFLSLAVENCLHLSLSLFRRKDEGQELDFIELDEFPSLVEALVSSVNKFADPIVAWMDRSALISNILLDNRGVKSDVNSSIRIRVDVSMLWIILLSLLRNKKQQRVGNVQIDLNLQFVDEQSESCTRRAELCLTVQYDCAVATDCVRDAADSAVDDSTLQAALVLLLRGFEGRLSTFENNPQFCNGHQNKKRLQIELPLVVSTAVPSDDHSSSSSLMLELSESCLWNDVFEKSCVIESTTTEHRESQQQVKRRRSSMSSVLAFMHGDHRGIMMRRMLTPKAISHHHHHHHHHHLRAPRSHMSGNNHVQTSRGNTRPSSRSSSESCHGATKALYASSSPSTPRSTSGSDTIQQRRKTLRMDVGRSSLDDTVSTRNSCSSEQVAGTVRQKPASPKHIQEADTIVDHSSFQPIDEATPANNYQHLCRWIVASLTSTWKHRVETATTPKVVVANHSFVDHNEYSDIVSKSNSMSISISDLNALCVNNVSADSHWAPGAAVLTNSEC